MVGRHSRIVYIASAASTKRINSSVVQVITSCIDCVCARALERERNISARCVTHHQGARNQILL